MLRKDTRRRMSFRRISPSDDDDPPRVATRPQRPPPPHLNIYVASLFADVAAKTRFAEPGLLQRWTEIVGAEAARLGRPGRILGGTRGATLELIAADGASAARLRFEAESLRQRVNQFLGPNRIGRIHVRQSGAADGAPLESALSRFRASMGSKPE
jgi:hypothetical protein